MNIISAEKEEELNQLENILITRLDVQDLASIEKAVFRESLSLEKKSKSLTLAQLHLKKSIAEQDSLSPFRFICSSRLCSGFLLDFWLRLERL